MHQNDQASVRARRAAHATRLRADLERILALLRTHPGVQRVILFGSLSREQSHSRSDLDWVVIQETSKPFMDRLHEIYRLLLPRVPTDLLVYTPDEWPTLSRTRRFGKRIEEEGRVLYDAVAARDDR